jgi:hypothetical protein
MAYSIFTPTGSEYAVTPLSVPDNAIDTGLYNAANKLGVQLVGRNAIDYGTAIAQNTIQLASNFAGTVAPTAAKSFQGQLWFRVTSASAGLLYVRNSTTAGGEFPSGWEKLVTVDAAETGTFPIVNPVGTPGDGDIQVVGSVISIYANGGWRQVFPAVYS